MEMVPIGPRDDGVQIVLKLEAVSDGRYTAIKFDIISGKENGGKTDDGDNIIDGKKEKKGA